MNRSGQAMVEYLLVAGVILGVLFTLRGPIQEAANSLMNKVGNQVTVSGGTADQLLGLNN